MDKCKVLVVDDDKEIVNAIAKLLQLQGIQCLKAYNGEEALDVLVNQEVHLIVMDIMMPKMNGLSATMKIRESKNIPIIIISAKSEESDKIIGLSMGADDYVTKPFSADELVARIKSHLRRYTNLGDITKVNIEDKIQIGGLVLDYSEKKVSVDGVPVKLTATEYKILEFLMKNAGNVFSAEKIYQSVWNEDAYSVENTVMVHIRHIREKIEIDSKNPRYLKVVWGIGYKIEKEGNL